MARHGKVLIALAVSLLALTLAAAEQGGMQAECGTQAGNKTCPNNLCCSKFGFCGRTEPFCGSTCQIQCWDSELSALGGGPAGNEQCGRQASFQTCPNNLCCSQFGFCGKGDAWCGGGCQSQCSVNQIKALGGGPAGNEQCGRQASFQTCPNNLCCSKFGFCGKGDAWCGGGCQSQCSVNQIKALGGGPAGNEQCGRQAGGQTCPNNLCCSKFGFCGKGDAWCGGGCQSQCSVNQIKALGGGPAGNEQCGRQAGGQTCPNNLCCSKFGFCGKGDAWCGGGCQSQCSVNQIKALGGGPAGNEQCGRQASFQTCPNNLCCSKFGFCGKGDDYCGGGCQSQCNVNQIKALGGGPAGNEQCGRQAGGQTCPNNLCCSQFGFCGKGDAWCGGGCQSQCSVNQIKALGGGPAGNEQCGRQASFQTCPNNLCCSKFGFCGKGDDYCGGGCQSQCSVNQIKALGGGPAGNEQCGRQASFQTCPNNLCCSQFGFCGKGDAWCGGGCQSQCSVNQIKALGGGPAGNEQCGRQAGGQTCPNNLCCSKFGFCGKGDAWCGGGCQSQCSVNQIKALGGGPAGNEQCGRQASFQTCPNNLCCSKFGFCGKGDDYCGGGCQSQCNVNQIKALGGGPAGNEQCGRQASFQTCPNNLCCSKFGFCGKGDAWCGGGCQSQCNNGGLRASTGKASYYSTYIPSACYGNDQNPLPRNRHMAAVSDGNPNLWKNGQGCGKHYRIRCQGNGCRNGDAIIIKVVDRCPNGCEGHVFDLSEEAFGAIADKNAGVIKVQYEPVNSEEAIPWAQKKLIVEVGQIRK